MNLDHQFTSLQLAIINEQAALYSCACPLQVSLQITSLRKLFDYQEECSKTAAVASNPVQTQVHEKIAEATRKAHQIMEACLDEILVLEGWDKSKMAMPEGIRQLKDVNQ